MKNAVAAILLTTLLALCTASGCHHGPIKADATMTMKPPPVGPVVAMPVERGGPHASAAEKIALIDVDGLLLNRLAPGMISQGDNPVAIFREKLDAAAADACVRAVVLRINSPGGGVTASDIMWHDLQSFKSRTGLPVVACLLDVGAGGAYYLATAADRIVAHPTTVVGGIGVILNTYNLQDAMAQFNVVATPIKSGEHIDMGTPIKSMNDESRQMLQEMADQMHGRFRGIVEQARQPPAEATVFDGRVFTAPQALQLRLIDDIGYLDDAIDMARSFAGVQQARVVFFHRCVDRAHSPYSVTPNTTPQSGFIPLSIPGLERARLPTFLYLWQPEPTLER